MWVDAKYCWLLLLILLVPNIPKQCAWVVVICPSPYHYPVPQLAGCVHHFWILPFLVLQNGSPMGLPIQLFFCGLTWFALVCFGLLWLSLPSRDSFGCPGVPGHLRCWEAPVGLYASAVRKHRLSAWISCWWRSSEELPPTTGVALRTSEKGQSSGEWGGVAATHPSSWPDRSQLWFGSDPFPGRDPCSEKGSLLSIRS